MNNKQYSISVNDVKKFKELKNTSLYKVYINNIINSPIFINIANEHIKNIDITEDIEQIMEDDNLTSTKLNKLFKDTIKLSAVNMIADTLIVNDIIDVSFEDAKEELEENFKIKYLLGLADEEYYDRAKTYLESNPDTSSLIYQGYQEYLKYKKKDLIKKSDLSVITPTAIEPIKKSKELLKKSKKKTVDIDSNDIEF